MVKVWFWATTKPVKAAVATRKPEYSIVNRMDEDRAWRIVGDWDECGVEVRTAVLCVVCDIPVSN